MLVRILCYLIMLFFCSAYVQADSFEFSSARSDALGGTTLLSTPLPSEQLRNGSLLKNPEFLTVDFGFKRQYNLKELDLLQTAISYKYKNYSFITGFAQLGDVDIYTIKTMRFGLLYTKSFFTIGNFITSELHDFNNHYQSVRGYAYSISIHLKHKDFLLSSVIENINKPSLSVGSLPTEPKISLYGELQGSSIYKTTLKLSFQKNKENNFGFGESVKISETGTLLFGFSNSPVQFGGGVEIHWNNNSMIYTAKLHPVLGLTHTVSFLLKVLHH